MSNIAARIERIPFNPFHWHLLMIGGWGMPSTGWILRSRATAVIFMGIQTRGRSLEDITAEELALEGRA